MYLTCESSSIRSIPCGMTSFNKNIQYICYYEILDENMLIEIICLVVFKYFHTFPMFLSLITDNIFLVM